MFIKESKILNFIIIININLTLVHFREIQNQCLLWVSIPFIWFYAIFYLFIYFWSFCLFRATPTAYGGSQARGPIGIVATSLCQSHSNVGSQLRLWPTPQLMAMPDPLAHWVRPGIEAASLWMLVRFINHWAMTGTWYTII